MMICPHISVINVFCFCFHLFRLGWCSHYTKSTPSKSEASRFQEEQFFPEFSGGAFLFRFSFRGPETDTVSSSPLNSNLALGHRSKIWQNSRNRLFAYFFGILSEVPSDKRRVRMGRFRQYSFQSVLFQE